MSAGKRARYEKTGGRQEEEERHCGRGRGKSEMKRRLLGKGNNNEKKE